MRSTWVITVSVLAVPGLLGLAQEGGSPRAAPNVASQVSGIIRAASQSGELESAKDFLDQADRLIDQFENQIHQLESALLRADVARARGRAHVAEWQRDSGQSSALRTARDHLNHALGRYEQVESAAKKETERLSRTAFENSGAGLQESQFYRDAVARASRARFGIAWTHYYLGLAADDGSAVNHLRTAVAHFETFTRKEQRDHPIIADCYLGQALCHVELAEREGDPRQYDRAITLLEPATRANTPADALARQTALLVWCFAAVGQNHKLHVTAERYFAGLPEDQRLDAVELNLALEWARALSRLAGASTANPYQKQYEARLGNVVEFIYPHGEPWRSQLRHAVGQGDPGSLSRYVDLARTQFVEKHYAEAMLEAERGLAAESADNMFDVGLRADLRHLRAAAAWNLRQWSVASEFAQEFVEHHPDDGRAREMTAYAVEAGLLELDSSQPGPGVNGVDPHRLLRFLDGAGNAVRVPLPADEQAWYRGRVLLLLSAFTEAEEEFGKIDATSDYYLRGLQAQAMAACKRIETPSSEVDSETALRQRLDALKRTLDLVTRFTRACPPPVDAKDRPAVRGMVDVTLTAAEWSLTLPGAGQELGRTLLIQSEKLVVILDETSYRSPYRGTLAVLVFLQSGDEDAAFQRLDQLVRSADDDPHAVRVLTRIGELLERRYDKLAQAERTEAAQGTADRLVGVYTYLYRRLPDSTSGDTLRQQAVIRLHLADALRRTGNARTALSHYEWLRENVPTEQAADVLRGMAIAYEQTDRFDEAIASWRTLALGLGRSTDRWLEARYHLIDAHRRAGRPEHAAKLLQMFRMQHGTVESEPWRRRFDDLAYKLELPRTRPANEPDPEP